MTKNLVIGAAVILVIVLVGIIFWQQNQKEIREQQVKTPHFLDSTPFHGEVYSAQPINVTVNFDFDLAQKSKISVISLNGSEWTEDEVLIEDNKTALKKNLKQGAPDGWYFVKYTTCWPDGSCHDGQFNFSIDSAKKLEYLDLRGKSEVEIKMKDLKFNQNKIIISPKTKVTWTNEDDAGHFVNTETHPEHTYYPVQNSGELTKSQSFAITFEVPGQYNYHCSAHVPEGMIASLIVSN